MRSLIVMLAVAGCGGSSEQPDATDASVSSDIDAAPRSPPTRVQVTANVTRGARVSWVAPAGNTPTGYMLTVSPAGGTVRIAGLSAVVTDLVVGESYTFSVTATYPDGSGPPSTPSAPVTVVKGPSPPSLLACGANTQATLRSAPVGDEVSYNIYAGTDPMTSMVSVAPMSTVAFPFTHTGLANGTTYYYVVTSVDSSGVESVESTSDSALVDAAAHDALFASSYAGADNAIAIVDCLSKYPSGSTAAVRTIKGPNAGILTSAYNNIAIDAATASIYYRNPGAILVFGNATVVEGDIVPTRAITSSALTGGSGIALDTTRDVLYVLDAQSAIRVFTNASTANGTVSPARTITATTMTTSYGLTLDAAADRLYVSNRTEVLVFDNASTATGLTAPARTLTTSGVAMTNYGTGLDITRDIVYIAARNAQQFSAVTASTANGAVAPARSLTGISTPMGAQLAGDRLLFVSDNASTRIQYWDNASTLSGSVAPNYVLIPTLSAMSGFAYAP